MDINRIPTMFLKGAAERKLRNSFSSSTILMTDENCDYLGSISAFVTKKEECEEIAEEMFLCSSEEQNYDEDSDLESDTDDEELQCVVCKLEFAGEDKLEQHNKIAQHWG